MFLKHTCEGIAIRHLLFVTNNVYSSGFILRLRVVHCVCTSTYVCVWHMGDTGDTDPSLPGQSKLIGRLDATRALR